MDHDTAFSIVSNLRGSLQQFIALTTDYLGSDFGIYVYDLDRERLQRIADAYIDTALAYVPSWSYDDQWLAFRTAEGYFVERISDGTRIPLDEKMNGSQLFWSPVMDYEASQCMVQE